MGKIFYYTKTTYGPTTVKEVNGEKVESREEVKWRDGFNLDCVTRVIEEPGGIMVVLNDGHEEAIDVPEKRRNGGVEMVRRREWMVSDIHIINKEEIEDFHKVTSANSE